MPSILVPPNQAEIILEDTGALCWFCGARPANPETPFFVDFWDPNSIEHRLNKKIWTTIKVPIPQCEPCAEYKRKEKTSIGIFTVMLFLFGAGGLGIGIPLETSMGDDAPPIAVIMMFVGVAVAIGLFVLITVMRRKKSPAQAAARRDIREQPRIKKLLEQGWKLGIGPTN